jgi:hypothetical protein
MLKVLTIAAALFLVHSTAIGAVPDGGNEATVFVEATRSSAFIHILINNHRKIGNIALEVKDLGGRVLYREEGKAMTGELVRRLDKGVFPKGEHTVTVVSRDFTITQRFTIE